MQRGAWGVVRSNFGHRQRGAEQRGTVFVLLRASPVPNCPRPYLDLRRMVRFCNASTCVQYDSSTSLHCGSERLNENRRFRQVVANVIALSFRTQGSRRSSSVFAVSLVAFSLQGRLPGLHPYTGLEGAQRSPTPRRAPAARTPIPSAAIVVDTKL